MSLHHDGSEWRRMYTLRESTSTYQYAIEMMSQMSFDFRLPGHLCRNSRECCNQTLGSRDCFWFPMVTTLIGIMRQLDPYYEFNLKVELKI